MRGGSVTVAALPRADATDAALRQLLREAYVAGGFTAPEAAETLFAPEAVRARGTVFGAWDDDGALLGTVTLVAGGTASSRLAPAGEAEVHLLAVARAARGRGVGAALVTHLLEAAAGQGLREAWLWTQPAMADAQRLYERLGFRRAPAHDFAREARRFLVYRRPLPVRSFSG